MGRIKSYKDLEVWKKSHRAALLTIEVVDGFPKSQIFRVVGDQLLRSITSVSANISEGFASFGKKEYRRYLGIALRSALESDNWVQLIKDSDVLSSEVNLEAIHDIEELNIESIKMLITMMKKLDK